MLILEVLYLFFDFLLDSLLPCFRVFDLLLVFRKLLLERLQIAFSESLLSFLRALQHLGEFGIHRVLIQCRIPIDNFLQHYRSSLNVELVLIAVEQWSSADHGCLPLLILILLRHLDSKRPWLEVEHFF